MCWDRQRLPIRSNKDDMARAALSPLNVVSRGYCFQALNPPVAGIVLHLFEDFINFTHGIMILNVIAQFKTRLCTHHSLPQSLLHKNRHLTAGVVLVGIVGDVYPFGAKTEATVGVDGRGVGVLGLTDEGAEAVLAGLG